MMRMGVKRRTIFKGSVAVGGGWLQSLRGRGTVF